MMCIRTESDKPKIDLDGFIFLCVFDGIFRYGIYSRTEKNILHSISEQNEMYHSSLYEH